ncbi:MAG: O-methyltransferase, partial [Bacteroidia bacterium]
AYFNLLKNKLKPGSVLLADNVLWSGKVIDEQELKNDAETRAIHQFNEMVATDASFENVILPIRDGITVARKI